MEGFVHAAKECFVFHYLVSAVCALIIAIAK
jgi:hypothetical protein